MSEPVVEEVKNEVVIQETCRFFKKQIPDEGDLVMVTNLSTFISKI